MRLQRILLAAGAVVMVAVALFVSLIFYMWAFPPTQCVSDVETRTMMCWQECWGPFGWCGARVWDAEYDPRYPDLEATFTAPGFGR